MYTTGQYISILLPLKTPSLCAVLRNHNYKEGDINFFMHKILNGIVSCFTTLVDIYKKCYI